MLTAGIIISVKNTPTKVVMIVNSVKHKKYGKLVEKNKKYLVHDEHNLYGLGSRVYIKKCSPFSKRKSWKIIKSL
ncbi:30S ribosomal protein S17 [Candidatus Hodgkinia cicadicola]